MKVTKVTALPLMAPIGDLARNPVSIPNPEVLGKVVFGGYRSLLVHIETDEGISGIGEGLVRLAPRATMEIINELSAAVIGRDPHETQLIWNDLYSLMMNRGHNRGFFIEAIAAVDIALWDIRGKALDMPLFRLLGGNGAATPCYASSLRLKDPATTAEEARQLAADGFTAIKLKIGRGSGHTSEDIACIKATREAIGDSLELMVDGNCGYTLADAVKIGRTLERVNASWFEEPFSPDNLGAYQALRQKIDVPIAGGETWFTRYDFRDAFVQEAIDIAQPDVARCGGISETRRVADLAAAFHVAFAPHTGQSSLVCLIAALHLAASHPNTLTYEFIAVDWSKDTPNPLRHSLGRPQLETLRSGSTVQPPGGPGLGISIDWDGMKRHCL